MRLHWPDVAPPAESYSLDAEQPLTGDAYVRRFRSVEVGPAVTVVFENRQTLWFRVQELARLARLTRAETVRTAMNWYEQLLPSAHRLTGAIWVVERGRRPTRELEVVRRAISRGSLALQSSEGMVIPGHYLPQASTDRLIGLSQWAEFHFDPDLLAALAQPTGTWRLLIESVGYCHTSEPLSQEIIHSLLGDLRGSSNR